MCRLGILNHNIIATYNVFEEARHADVVRVVYASSNHVQRGQVIGDKITTLAPFYARGKGYISLSDPPSPDSLYAVSKLFGENLGWYYWKFYGLECIILRIGSISNEDSPLKWKGSELEYMVRAIFLSKRDCVNAFKRALEVDCGYLVAYAISDNDRRFFDMKESMEKLGTHPQDNAENYD